MKTKKKSNIKIFFITLLLIIGFIGIYSIYDQNNKLSFLKQPGKVIYNGQTFEYFDKTLNQVKTIDWGKTAQMPESNSYEKAYKVRESFKILDLITTFGLSQEEITNISKDLGISQNDIVYYEIANKSYQERFDYTVKSLKEFVKSTDDFTKVISLGKKEVNGKAIITQDILDELFRLKYINSQFKNYLDSLRYNPDTNKVESNQKYQPQGQPQTPIPIPTTRKIKIPETTNCSPDGMGGVRCITY